MSHLKVMATKQALAVIENALINHLTEFCTGYATGRRANQTT